MVEIKGSAISDSISSVKNRSGEKEYNKILDLLSIDTRKLFEDAEILFTSWYPLDAFTEFLAADIKTTADGDENVLIERSEAVIEKQLRGIYKIFVKIGSPEFVLNRMSNAHQSYFRGVVIDVTMIDKGKAIIKYTGFDMNHRLIEYAIIGFYKKALEISGAKNVNYKNIASIKEGKGFFELELTWTNK